MLLQLGELRDQLYRQIVHGVEPEILEGFQHGAFAGPAESGDDYQFRLMGGFLFFFLARQASF